MSASTSSPSHPRLVALLGGLLAALVAVGALGVVSGPSAAAHAQLISSTPTDGATVAQAPEAAELVFNEEINPAFAQVVIADAAQVSHTVTPTAAGPKVTAPLPQGLPKGKVAVRYKVVSKDGHPISGQVTFTLTSGKDPVPAAGTEPGAAGSAAAAQDRSGGDQDSGEAGSSGWIYGLTGFAALVLVGVGALILRWERQGRRG